MTRQDRPAAGRPSVPRRRFLATAGTAGGLGLAGCLGSTGGGDGTAPRTGTNGNGGPDTTSDGGTASGAEEPWRTTELADVRTDETFTVTGFDAPVLLETFAVWCPVCTNQQRRIAALHERREDFVSVSLNTDPNEDAARVREHLDRHGFDWRYAVAPPEMTRSLKESFGSVVLSPTQAPVVLRCADGSARLLETGVKSADTLAEHLESC